MKAVWIAVLVIVAVIAVMLFGSRKANAPKEVTVKPDVNFRLVSAAFMEESAIPAKYTCAGQNISPPLEISGVPSGTASLSLILHDPDAPGGDFLHWTVWNIKPDTTNISENTVPIGAVQGMTGFGMPGYGGPCPPSGIHHYIFDLYALDNSLNLDSGANRQTLIEAMEGHTIATTKLTGTFTKQ